MTENNPGVEVLAGMAAITMEITEAAKDKMVAPPKVSWSPPFDPPPVTSEVFKLEVVANEDKRWSLDKIPRETLEDYPADPDPKIRAFIRSVVDALQKG